MMSSKFSSATALAIFAWMGWQREIKNHSHVLAVIKLKSVKRNSFKNKDKFLFTTLMSSEGQAILSEQNFATMVP